MRGNNFFVQLRMRAQICTRSLPHLSPLTSTYHNIIVSMPARTHNELFTYVVAISDSPQKRNTESVRERVSARSIQHIMPPARMWAHIRPSVRADSPPLTAMGDMFGYACYMYFVCTFVVHIWNGFAVGQSFRRRCLSLCSLLDAGALTGALYWSAEVFVCENQYAWPDDIWLVTAHTQFAVRKLSSSPSHHHQPSSSSAIVISARHHLHISLSAQTRSIESFARKAIKQVHYLLYVCVRNKGKLLYIT